MKIRICHAFLCASLVPTFIAVAAIARGADDDEAAPRGAPGIVARYESKTAGGQARVVDRIEPVPRLFGRPGETPDPGLPAGEFHVRWTGQLLVPYRSAYVFTVSQSSLDDLRLSLDGRPIALGEPVDLLAAGASLVIEGTHRQGAPAFQLWWRSGSFADEPIEARFFSHDPRDVDALSAEAGRVADRGAELADRLGCFRCHGTSPGWGDTLGSELTPAGQLPGPRLDQLGKRVQRGWLEQWLLNPAATEPGATRMPALFADTPADRLSARIVAAFLAHDPLAADPPAGSVTEGERLYESVGCAACHAAPRAAADADRGFVSEVPSLKEVKRKWTAAGLAEFIEHPLKTRSHGRMPDFNLLPAQAIDIAAYLLSTGTAPQSAAPVEMTNQELATAWKRLRPGVPLEADGPLASVAVAEMAARQCFSCHEIDTHDRLAVERQALGSPALKWQGNSQPGSQPPVAPALIDVSAERAGHGCLAADGRDPKSPRFTLSNDDRQALAAFVGRLTANSSISTMERMRIDLAELNCLRCHANEESGGHALAALAGDDEAARFSLPPTLTAAGERVRAIRLRQWLTRGAGEDGLRPWVRARMPGFGPHGQRIAGELAARDGSSTVPAKPGPTVPTIAAPQIVSDHLQTGRFLVGTKALACVNCHTLHGKLLSGQPDPTTRAPDLTKVAGHLRPEYFQRWMMNPARIRPGTKMPQAIQPGGSVPIAALATLPAGTPLNALWTYLSEGPAAPPPADEPSVLVRPNADQPVVQRGEINAGDAVFPRGVAIGFGEGTLLFDADRLSLVAAWYGGFLRGGVGPYFGPTWAREGGDVERFAAEPHMLAFQPADGTAWQDFALPLDSDPNVGTRFEGYQVGKTSIRLRYRLLLADHPVQVAEELRLERSPEWQGFARALQATGLPAGSRLALRVAGDKPQKFDLTGQPVSGTDGPSAAPLVLCEAQGKPVVYHVAATQSGKSALDLTTWQTDSAVGLRLISAPAAAGAPVQCRIDRWTYLKPGIPAAADLAKLQTTAPALNDAFEAPIQSAQPLAHVESIETRKAAAVRERRRPAVNPKENVDEFTPVQAKFLRFAITATDQNAEPGLDELEVYGGDPAHSIGPTGKASASSVIKNYAQHQIAHLNDGKLGNDHSWISGEQGRGWVQIEFPEPVKLCKVVWARDRTGQCKDRLPTDYRIEVSDDQQEWTLVSDAGDRLLLPGQGALAANASPGYLMEAIPAPFPGCRPSDIAFGDDDSMYALAMTEGQVWRTRRPPEGQPTAVSWKRFASGLYHPIGMQIIDGRIFVAQKPEITELVDRDGDGTADQFRTVASGWGLSTGWHEYTFGLAADRQKNLWISLNTGYFWTNPGYVNPGRWRGGILKVSYEADHQEVVAKGCRVPNGIARGPNGDIFYTDNQGDWIQSCKLAAVVPGRFYGHPEYKEDALPDGTYPDGRSAVWMPYNLSRSTSGPVHDETSGKFGPFADQMFVGDAGYGANPGIMRVALEKVAGEYQGACFRFVDNQPHGCERMKFGPDNQLYVAALTTGLTRLKFVGPAPLAIRSVHIRPAGQGFVLQLTRPLAADSKLDPKEFRVKRYHYLYTGNYGSPQADETGVPVAAAELSSDRQSVTLTFPVVSYPIGMVYEINAGTLHDENNEPLMHNEAWYTVHRIPD
jgi:hypothetical protein